MGQSVVYGQGPGEYAVSGVLQGMRLWAWENLAVGVGNGWDY